MSGIINRKDIASLYASDDDVVQHSRNVDSGSTWHGFSIGYTTKVLTSHQRPHASPKRERIKRKTYKDREEAKRDIFNYIEMFYNPIRRHSSAEDLSPIEFERQHYLTSASV